MRTVLEVVCKALLGGSLVLAFALIATTLSPKRFAGLFAAAPSVALASLSMTALFKDASDAQRACAGMVAGAVAFIAYCLVAPSALRRFGAVKGSALSLLAWAAVAGVVLPLSAGMAAAQAATVGALRCGSRPSLACDPGKAASAGARELVVRFAFGAGTSVLAAVVSIMAGPVVGGLFLAFPAILLASLTLVADEEGQAAARDDARGAAAGAVGMTAFALVGAHTLGSAGTPAALALAAAAWAGTALCCYAAAWLTGHGDDEPRRS